MHPGEGTVLPPHHPHCPSKVHFCLRRSIKIMRACHENLRRTTAFNIKVSQRLSHPTNPIATLCWGPFPEGVGNRSGRKENKQAFGGRVLSSQCVVLNGKVMAMLGNKEHWHREGKGMEEQGYVECRE